MTRLFVVFRYDSFFYTRFNRILNKGPLYNYDTDAAEEMQ